MSELIEAERAAGALDLIRYDKLLSYRHDCLVEDSVRSTITISCGGISPTSSTPTISADA